jgi:hypothetical protein
MSPNESQLRAALRDGEGRSLDVDAVVAGAVRVRRARRQRITSVAGAVVIVAGVATGGALLFGHGSGGGAAGSAATYGLSRSAQPAGGHATRYAQEPAASAAAARIPCPASQPRLMPPGGGGSGLFGGNGALFGRSVSVVKVCGYPSGRSVVLTGARARAVVTSMESASKSRIPRQCPDSTTGVSASLAVYAVDASGNPSRVVTVTLGCRGLLTNGTAVRYAWSPPPLLSSLALHERPGVPPPAGPSR